MLKVKGAAPGTAAARGTAEAAQVQSQAAEAIAVASSREPGGGAVVDLAAIADDLPRLQETLLRQWQTVKDCERQMTKIKQARTIAGGGAGGGRRGKAEAAAYKLYEKKRDAALRVISGREAALEYVTRFPRADGDTSDCYGFAIKTGW